ncbi:MAG: 3-oxoacyl-ACP reductase FabG [Candidatus Pseudoscilispira sp.]|nr:3-oxoacyl-ACP reductase FabG [Candidatus Pseudoscilispira sp.]
MSMNRVALVTGAGRGIGRAIALKLAGAGWDVAVNYRTSAAGAEEIASNIIILGRRAIAVQADVADAQAVRSMVADVEDRLGPVSLLVNNAGLSWTGLFQDTDYEAWRRLFTVNVDGAYHCIQAVLPRMLHEKEGNIINVTSIWGLHGASCEVAYAATKAALVGLTKSLAAELAPSGIRVNAVAPGCIDSDMLRALGKEAVASLAQETPMGRIGTAEDIAKVVRFLAVADSDFITGQVLTADGGFTL